MRLRKSQVPELTANERMWIATISDIETFARDLNAYYDSHPGPVDAELQEIADEAYTALEALERAYIPSQS